MSLPRKYPRKLKKFLTWLSINMNGEDDANDHSNGGNQGKGDHVSNHLATFDLVCNHLIANLGSKQKKVKGLWTHCLTFIDRVQNLFEFYYFRSNCRPITHYTCFRVFASIFSGFHVFTSFYCTYLGFQMMRKRWNFSLQKL